MQGSVAELGAAVMQQADVAALWLLEALILTLPQSLLQAYIVLSTDVGIMSPGNLSLVLLDVCDRSLVTLWTIYETYLFVLYLSLFSFSGLLLWSVCAVRFLGIGSLQ